MPLREVPSHGHAAYDHELGKPRLRADYARPERGGFHRADDPVGARANADAAPLDRRQRWLDRRHRRHRPALHARRLAPAAPSAAFGQIATSPRRSALSRQGWRCFRTCTFDVIGNVDADVSFPPDFFAYLLDQFAADPKLGVAGTHYVEGDFHSFRDSFINPEHVNGQCQLFRRACFEDIGGYVPIEGGGIDWVAVTTARMKGWTTRSFGERVFEHHRKMGTAGGNELRARYAYGKKDYALGGHPMWQLLRGCYQMMRPPYVVGGLLLLAGYFGSWLSGAPRNVSPELMKFYRSEQMKRLRDVAATWSLSRHPRRSKTPAELHPGDGRI